MAFINLLHNGYQGKLGETVGQKWKNQRTVRTYNPHNTSKSLAQEDVRYRYKRNIRIASECYPYFFGAQYVNPKNMNKFNAFTSAIDKIYNVRHEELVNTGIFKKHTGTQLQPTLAYSKAFTYLIYPAESNPQVSSVTKLKAVGILVQETRSSIEAPLIDTNNTWACYAKFVVELGPIQGGEGVVVQLGARPEYVEGSIIQVALTIQGKECIQKPVIIKDIPEHHEFTRIAFSQQKLIQKF